MSSVPRHGSDVPPGGLLGALDRADRLMVAGRFDHVTPTLYLGSGARPQILHREVDSRSFFLLPKPNLNVSKIWVVTDLLADKGPTLLGPDVLGSCVGTGQARRPKP